MQREDLATRLDRIDVEAIPLRLKKLLSQHSGLANSEIESAFNTGETTIERKGCTVYENKEETSSCQARLGSLVFLGDKVTFVGKEIEVKSEPKHYYILNKPKGVLTAAKGGYAGKDTLEMFLADLPGRVNPVGRLDRLTTGLLVLTDDGDLSHLITKTGNLVEKEYQLTVKDRKGTLTLEDKRLVQLREGVDLKDGPAQVVKMSMSGGVGTNMLKRKNTNLPSSSSSPSSSSLSPPSSQVDSPHTHGSETEAAFLSKKRVKTEVDEKRDEVRSDLGGPTSQSDMNQSNRLEVVVKEAVKKLSELLRNTSLPLSQVVSELSPLFSSLSLSPSPSPLSSPPTEEAFRESILPLLLEASPDMFLKGSGDRCRLCLRPPSKEGTMQYSTDESVSPEPGTARVNFTISVGRNRIVRRMCTRVHLPLLHLHRVRVGNIHLSSYGLDDVYGKVVPMTDKDISALWEMAGGRTHVILGKVRALAKKFLWETDPEQNPKWPSVLSLVSPSSSLKKGEEGDGKEEGERNTSESCEFDNNELLLLHQWFESVHIDPVELIPPEEEEGQHPAWAAMREKYTVRASLP